MSKQCKHPMAPDSIRTFGCDRSCAVAALDVRGYAAKKKIYIFSNRINWFAAYDFSFAEKNAHTPPICQLYRDSQRVNRLRLSSCIHWGFFSFNNPTVYFTCEVFRNSEKNCVFCEKRWKWWLLIDTETKVIFEEKKNRTKNSAEETFIVQTYIGCIFNPLRIFPSVRRPTEIIILNPV